MAKKIRELIPDGLSQSAIAEACEVTQQAVAQWLEADRIPAKRVKAFSKVTGLHRSVLNPEIFDESDESAA
ncbi:YdaS family helix-turn-helix protein [Shewanella bicestrii]